MASAQKESSCATAEEISVQHWRGSVLSGIDSLDDALPYYSSSKLTVRSRRCPH